MRVSSGIIFTLLLSVATARSEPNGAMIKAPITAEAQMGFWTPQRLANAKPMLKMTSKIFSPAATAIPQGGPRTGKSGSPSSLPYDPTLGKALPLITSAIVVTAIPVPPPWLPAAVGSVGPRYPYTSARLYACGGACPGPAVSNVYAYYPNPIVGQLFFSTPNGEFVCSASVVRLSVIATAGHCVSDGNGHFYNNWLFIPARYAGKAPFGQWGWAQAFVTGPWFHGGGSVPNTQDDAVIVLQANSSGQKIGQLTGWLGYEFNAPLPNHVTQLGYPCNLDGCSDPISDNSQLFEGPKNNFEIGTASFGGASGGPWVQDFGQMPSHGIGTPPSEAFGGNILIASTSYTYTNTAIQVDGGSVLAAPGQFGGSLNTFGDLINGACGTPGNC